VDSLNEEIERLRAAASVRAAVSIIAPEIAPPNIELPELYEAQERIKAEARRFNVVACGRRWGKSFLGSVLIAETALAGQPAAWVAPNYKLLLEIWQTLTRTLRPVADRINASERRIELNGGGLIEFWTMDSDDPGRSRKYKLVIIDEAAMAANLKTVWEASLRPALTDLEGSMWALSTPRGLNHFHTMFGYGQSGNPEWRSWTQPSAINPYLPPAEIEAARLELPALVFKQEYLAEFLQEEGATFRNVDACLNALASSPRDHEDHYLTAGVDWARKHDFTVISVICCHCRQEVKLDRFNQIGWDFQRQRLLSIIEGWRVNHTVLETNSIGEPNLQALRQIVNHKQILQGFETTGKSKAPLIQDLALAFEKESIQWLPDPVARHELIAYEATVMESGYTKYGAPEGGYDDTVIARALAWRAAKQRVPYPLTERQRIIQSMPENLRPGKEPGHKSQWDREAWHLAQDYHYAAAKRKVENKPSGSPLTNNALFDFKWRDE
jgi:hypothetical protein